jgi:DNA-binding XRE family transcriptional regulator
MTDRTKDQTRTLASELAKRLAMLGMSRRELARRTGLSRQTIHNIEHEGSSNLKQTTYKALDLALKWEPGTALALSLGQEGISGIEDRIGSYLARIGFHLSQMSMDQLELTLYMMEEYELGGKTESTQEFLDKVGALVEDLLKQITSMGATPGGNHNQHAS